MFLKDLPDIWPLIVKRFLNPRPPCHSQLIVDSSQRIDLKADWIQKWRRYILIKQACSLLAQNSAHPVI